MKKFRFGNGFIASDNKPFVMGIVNVTPDSFSDGGKYFEAMDAVLLAKRLIAEGADIIDIGAMSTRPDSKPVSEEEEIERLRNVVAPLAECGSIVSVDTVNPGTADYALRHGAQIINDVSGVFNEDMAEVVKRYNAGWIMTHTCNLPAGTDVHYENGVVNAVNEFFDDFLARCDSYGIDRERICLDAGFGFSKSVEDNVELLKNLDKVIREDVFFLTALSRKRFVGALTRVENPENRLVGTLIADLAALDKGSDILRVHDVAETIQSIAIYNGIK